MASNNDYSILAKVVLDLNNIQQQLNNAAKKVTFKVDGKGIRTVTAELGDMSSATDKASKAAESLGLTYQQAHLIMDKCVNTISSMVEQVYSLNSAMTEFKKVSDLRGSGLDDYVQGLAKMGLEVARTSSEMVDAATMFRKSGFNDQDAATLAKVAAQYQNVADTAVSGEEAAASIVSQIRAFGEDVEFATHVIDSYNEVANNFSVGTNDLSKAMEIASAGMATYGNEFEQIIGLVTAGTEIMTGRSLICGLR